MKYIISLLKQLIFGLVVLYGYNIIAVNFNLTLPINVITIGMVSFLGFPALFSLILLYVMIF